MLLALTGARRSSELQKLDTQFMSFDGNVAVFGIPTLTKNQRPGDKAKEFRFSGFPSCPAICVVDTLRRYCARTTELRSGPKQPLLLSFRKPHKPVTSSTIARWLLTVMADSGVDTDKYKAHSTRGASTSAARQKGAPVADILHAADWSRASTFQRFYCREVSEQPRAFSDYVLE